ncbi:phage tail protein [Cellulomonas sp. Marseille-Q8402]
MDAYLAEIRLLPYTYVPLGWLACDGQLLRIVDHPTLFQVIGTTYGGDGTETFALPDLRGRSAVHPGAGIPHASSGGSATHTLTTAELPSHTHQVRASSAPADAAEPGGAAFATTDRPHYGAANQVALPDGVLAPAGGGDQPHDNMPPHLVLTYAICVDGMYPSGTPEYPPFVGEVRMFAGRFAPEGWAVCDGQTLPIQQNTTLYSLLGNTYGGDGMSSFAVPDLRGASPVHTGRSVTGQTYAPGQRGGAAEVTLTQAQIPQHGHTLRAAPAGTRGTTGNPSGASFAVAQQGRARELLYRADGVADVTMNAAVGPAGGGQPHPNRSPYLAITMIIALEGIYPTRP